MNNILTKKGSFGAFKLTLIISFSIFIALGVLAVIINHVQHFNRLEAKLSITKQDLFQTRNSLEQEKRKLNNVGTKLSDLHKITQKHAASFLQTDKLLSSFSQDLINQAEEIAINEASLNIQKQEISLKVHAINTQIITDKEKNSGDIDTINKKLGPLKQIVKAGTNGKSLYFHAN